MNRRLLALALALLSMNACAPAATAEADVTVAPPSDGGVALVNPREAARLMDVHYDGLLRDAGVTGTVEAELTLNADGTVREVRVLDSTQEWFATSTRRVGPRLRFTPTVAGAQVRVRMHYVYNRNHIEVLGVVAGSRAAP
jgi:outer membrane biosynthesis protein TonB